MRARYNALGHGILAEIGLASRVVLSEASHTVWYTGTSSTPSSSCCSPLAWPPAWVLGAIASAAAEATAATAPAATATIGELWAAGGDLLLLST